MFGVSGWRVMAIGMTGWAVMMVIIVIIHMDNALFSVVAIIIGRHRNADRCTNGAAGNGAVTTADLGADGCAQPAADGAAQHGIAIHGQRRCGGQCRQGYQ